MAAFLFVGAVDRGSDVARETHLVDLAHAVLEVSAHNGALGS
jgi:hypothetical protein